MDVRRMIAARKRRSALGKTVPERPAAKPAADACPAELADKCVALGISTGGPPALTRLLAALRPPMPPIVIVQHMPPQFTGPLAARLDSISALVGARGRPGRRAAAELRADRARRKAPGIARPRHARQRGGPRRRRPSAATSRRST